MKKIIKSLFCLSLVIMLMFTMISLSSENFVVDAYSITPDVVGDPDPNTNTGLSVGDDENVDLNGVGNGSVGGEDPDPNTNTALGLEGEGNCSTCSNPPVYDPDPNTNTGLSVGDDENVDLNSVGNGSVGGEDPDPNTNTALGLEGEGNCSTCSNPPVYDPDPNTNTGLNVGDDENTIN